MSVARQRFCQLALSKIGSTVLWAENGPDLFDCSGLVLWALNGVGARLSDRNAQTLADQTPDLITAPGSTPLPGDLCFYGPGADGIIHVAIWLAGGRVLSADGATSRVKDKRTAEANPAARVRLHDKPQYRGDYHSTHRNLYLDDMERVSR